MTRVNNHLSFYTDGPIPAEVNHRCVYVQRTIDQTFLTLVEQGRHVSLVGARTMGKTSLVLRCVEPLASKGINVILIDVSSRILPRPNNSSEWMAKLCRVLARSLGVQLTSDSDGLQSEDPMHILEECLSELLNTGENNASRILIALDEIDSLHGLPYVDEIIGPFRNLRLKRGLANRVSFCTLGTVCLTAFSDPQKGSGWTFGTPLPFDDFPSDQSVIRAIARGFSRKMLNRHGVVKAILKETGGQPYLTIALANMADMREVQAPDDIRGLSTELAHNLGKQSMGLFHKISEFLENDSDGINAIQTYRRILKEYDEACTAEPTNAAKALLLRSGLVRENADQKLEVKSEIFRNYFDEHWTFKADAIASQRLQQSRGFTSKGRGRKVLIINKGGTLGMLEKDGKVVKPDNVEEFINFFPELRPQLEEGNIHYHHINPQDSINIYPEDWIDLAEFIYKNSPKDYSGVVVCHGTDTMAYTASAIAFALGPSLSFPVVFTGAQTTPHISHGDARTNLYRACLVAQEDIPEVVISFNDVVLRAVRAQKKDDRKFEGFESPTYPPLAEIAADIKINSKYVRMTRRQAKRRQNDFKLRAAFAKGILQVSQYPGLEPEFFNSHLLPPGEKGLPSCKGIIIQTLGAGNVANRDPYNFIPFVEHATEAGIPVIITSQYPPAPGSHTIYDTAMAPLRHGAIHTGNMTQSAAVTKFRWVLAQIDQMQKGRPWPNARKLEMVAQMMAEDYVGELDSGKRAIWSKSVEGSKPRRRAKKS